MRPVSETPSEVAPGAPIYLDEVTAEKALKARLKALDPAPQDFDETYLDALEDRIMSQVMKTSMEPKPKPGLFTRYWQKTQGKVSTSKTLPPLMAILALVISLFGLRPSSHLSSVQINSDELMQEALDSPRSFQILVNQLSGDSNAGGLNSDDFFVDVASQNFDHLTLHELDELLSSKSTSKTQ